MFTRSAGGVERVFSHANNPLPSSNGERGGTIVAYAEVRNTPCSSARVVSVRIAMQFCVVSCRLVPIYDRKVLPTSPPPWSLFCRRFCCCHSLYCPWRLCCVSSSNKTGRRIRRGRHGEHQRLRHMRRFRGRLGQLHRPFGDRRVGGARGWRLLRLIRQAA